MNLNYPAFALISLLPVIIGYIWYNPKWTLFTSAEPHIDFSKISIFKVFILFILSLTIVYGYMNVIIHQMGFYELFFTDIMMGSEEAKQITEDFLSTYGDKHRHFGHGVFHGAINAFVFALPFIGSYAILNGKPTKFVLYHFGYWLITSLVIGGLISEFV